MTTERQTGPDLRRAILDQTRRLLVTEGYERLSMRKIAGAVGCSATSIYLHFDNKDALTHALIGEGMERLGEALDASDPGGAAPARLRALGHAYVRFGLDNPEYYEVMFQLHPERMARYPAADYRRARRNIERFAEVLGEGGDAGSLAPSPTPDVSAHVLWTAMHGLVSLLLAQRVDVRLAGDAFVDAAIEQALSGVLVPEAAGRA